MPIFAKLRRQVLFFRALALILYSENDQIIVEENKQAEVHVFWRELFSCLFTYKALVGYQS